MMLKYLTLLLPINYILAWTTGPSLDSCEDMKPVYNETQQVNFTQNLPLTLNYEFQFSLRTKPIRKTELIDLPSNTSLSITIIGRTKNDTFEGLFLQIRPTNGSYNLQGEWTKFSKAAFQALNCDGIYHSAIGHRSSRLKLSATSIWRSPLNFRSTQRLSLYATLVKNKNESWVFQEIQKFLITPVPKTTTPPPTDPPAIVEQTSIYYMFETTAADQYSSYYYYYGNGTGLTPTERSLQELFDENGSGEAPTGEIPLETTMASFGVEGTDAPSGARKLVVMIGYLFFLLLV